MEEKRNVLLTTNAKKIEKLEQRITELAQQVRIRGERMERLYPWVSPDYMEAVGQTITYEMFRKWFDDDGKAL